MQDLYWDRDPREVPIYPVAEVARYLHLPASSLRKWLQTETYIHAGKPQTSEPLICRPDPSSKDLSFFNLVEAHLLQVLLMVKGNEITSMQQAIAQLAQNLGQPHPLTSKAFQGEGVDLLVESFGQLANLSRKKQLAVDDTLRYLLTRLEWGKDGRASRLYPVVQPGKGLSSERSLMIDPAVSFGRPVIAGTGISTSVVSEMYEAGDSIEAIAEDYDCTPEQIASAIYFESQDKAA
jgi:uncharacterized protein (DUF433 family)